MTRILGSDFIQITPTYTPEIVALSVCDIITISIQGMAGVICYISAILHPPENLCFHISTVQTHK